MTISVLLVDTHTIFREGVRVLLEATTDFLIVGEAARGTDALTLAGQLHPDVVILDYMMPGMNVVDVVARLRQQQPETKVVILSMHNDQSLVIAAIQNGGEHRTRPSGVII